MKSDLDALLKTIENFLSANPTTPLKYYEYDSPLEEFEQEKYSVESMVKRAFKLCKLYHSENPSGEIETQNDKARSSLDIWRHIKYFYPEITMLQVLAALYNLRDDLYTLKCPDVGRRVFKYQGSGAGGVNPIWNSNDEFGLQFYQWSIFPEILAEIEAQKNEITP